MFTFVLWDDAHSFDVTIECNCIQLTRMLCVPLVSRGIRIKTKVAVYGKLGSDSSPLNWDFTEIRRYGKCNK